MPKIPNSIRLKTGVYRILNIFNGKFYIGSTTLNFKVRWDNHRNELNRGKHCNSYLQRAWNAYGQASFIFQVIERCTVDKCLNREQYWLDRLEPWRGSNGYNLSQVAGSAMQGRNHSDASKLKMSIARKGIPIPNATKAAAEANRGKQRSQEVRDKIARGKRGKKLSDFHRQRITESHWSKKPNAAEIVARTAATKAAKREKVKQ